MAEHGNIIRSITGQSTSLAIAAALVVFTTAALVGCGGALDPTAQLRLNDTIPPVISVTSPTDGSSYPATVVVTGTVTDTANSEGDPGSVAGLSYAIPSYSIAGSAALDSDGRFSFMFSSAGFVGSITVEMAASDWNDNAARETLTLVEGSQIPGFEVASSGNKSVTLSWEEPPLSGGFTLYYTADGSVPSESNGTAIEGAVSPVTVEGLSNGTLYRFVVRSISTSGGDNWSDTASAIPASSSTLVPLTYAELGQIRLDWLDVVGAEGYDVLRSVSKSGPYQIISSGQLTHEFVNSGLSSDHGYWYRVQVSSEENTLSDPTWAQAADFPGRVATVPTGDSVGVVAVAGNYLYAVSDSTGLQIYDASDPTRLVALGSVALTGARDIYVAGGTAYLAAGYSGLEIVDVSNPNSPVLVNSIATDKLSRGVAVSGNYAYVAESQDGLDVIKISDPSNLSIDNTVGMLPDAYCVEIEGDYAYVGDASGVTVIGIVTPLSASVVDSNPIGPCYGMALQGGYAYAGAGAGLAVMNIGTPTAITVEKYLSFGSMVVTDVAVSGPYAYVVDPDSLHVVDVTFPAFVWEVESYPSESSFKKIDVAGSYSFIADSSAGIQVYDLASPAAWTVDHTVNSTDMVENVAVAGNYAYVVECDTGVKVIDISLPESASSITTVDTDGSSTGIAIVGDYAYVADINPGGGTGTAGFRVIDISSPGSANMVKSIDLLNDANDVAVFADYAYLANSNAGLTIIDISDPENAALVKSVDTDDDALGVAVDGEFAYVADNNGGLQIIDITDPESASFFKKIPMAQCRDAAIAGPYVYVGSGAGLQVVDVSRPPGTEIVHTASGGGAIYGLFVSGRFVYAGVSFGGFEVFRIDDPISAFSLGSSNSVINFGDDVVVAGGYAFVIDMPTGLRVVDLWPFD